MQRRRFLEIGAASPLLSFPVAFATKGGRVYQGDHIDEPARQVVVAGDYDVIVSGAGPAGVCAAIEAGRNGVKTLLIEAHGCLGGVWTSGLLTWILDQLNKPGLMREIEDKLLLRDGVSRDLDTGGVLSFDAEIMKLLLEDLCADAGVDVLFHARVVASAKNADKRLTHVITESKSGREAWMATHFIDTTGDGDLAARSGCGFDLGDEGKGDMQPFSMLAILTGINFDEVKEFSRWAGDSKNGSPSKKLLLQEILKGAVVPSYLKPGLYPIKKDLYMMMANHEYGYSSLNAMDVSRATLHARREVNNIVNALKLNGGAWSNIRLVATGEQIGTREGRRIHGLYTVNTNDLLEGARFDDAICRVTFGVDVHSVKKDHEEESNRAPGVKRYNRGIKSQDYDIPLRSLIAKDVGGLMMAGRCISGDFIAHSSYRVTGNAVAMGQAAGRVSALAAKDHVLPQDVDFVKTGLGSLD